MGWCGGMRDACTLPGRETSMELANEAAWDRVTRVILGLVLLYLGWAGVASGTLGAVFKILGVLPLVTGIVGWCPTHTLFGVATKKPDCCC